jgi:hypothetical protein
MPQTYTRGLRPHIANLGDFRLLAVGVANAARFSEHPKQPHENHEAKKRGAVPSALFGGDCAA